jgi:hypothetical protein
MPLSAFVGIPPTSRLNWKALFIIFFWKTADVVLREDRNELTENDLIKAFRFCIPFIWHCHKTTILNNPYVTASVLSGGDASLLHSVGITLNSQLAGVNIEDTYNHILKRVRDSAMNVTIDEKEKTMMRKRLEVWQIEAQVLTNRSNVPFTQPYYGDKPSAALAT